MQDALLEAVDSAVRNGLYPRPWKYSLMFAPQANRSRALFTLSVRDDDRVDLWIAPEAFESFFALDPHEVERQLGPAGPTTLQAEEIAALSDRLDELMADVAGARGAAQAGAAVERPRLLRLFRRRRAPHLGRRGSVRLRLRRRRPLVQPVARAPRAWPPRLRQHPQPGFVGVGEVVEPSSRSAISTSISTERGFRSSRRPSPPKNGRRRRR